ncbi:hypothetical protein IPM65_06655 [Candidatus Roizmanbacteria bacterium]|nr:MAG: hypothetical protein IPM65_06655 [Candidatus Roizmanbacteria bacterium]
MKSRRLLNHTFTDLKPFILIGLSVLLGLLLWKIPPSNIIIISFFIVITTLIVFLITSFFQYRPVQLVMTLFTPLVLALSYFVGFDIINTLLLLSFIIALTKLILMKDRKGKSSSET